MRDTTRFGLGFLIFGAIFSLIPWSLTFIVLLPFKVLGFVLTLVGFRLIFGSRTDDIPKYKGKSVISTIFHLLYLFFIPCMIVLMVVSAMNPDSLLWKILFFVVLAFAGLLFSLARGIFQMPLRKGFGKVMLVIVLVLSVLLTTIPPLFSGGLSIYASEKLSDNLDEYKKDLYDWSEPRNNTLDFNTTNQSSFENVTKDDLIEFIKVELFNPVLEWIHNNTNETVDAVEKVTTPIVVFGMPLVLADLSYSIASFFWLIILVGSIVTLGRREQKEKEMEEESEKEGDKEDEEEAVEKPEGTVELDKFAGEEDEEAETEESFEEPPPPEENDQDSVDYSHEESDENTKSDEGETF